MNSSRVQIVVRNEKVTVVHATAGPQGNQGVPGPQGPKGDPTFPDEWDNPPTLTLYFENGMN